jgi:hypothetical protein
MYRIKELNKLNMYLLITHWPDQNSILFLCGRKRRSNHVAPPSLPRHTLKRSLLNTLLLLLNTLLLLLPLLLVSMHIP